MQHAAPESGLHPPAEGGTEGILPVGGGHRICWYRCGHPAGMPALVLHGGPGSGHSAALTGFFDHGTYDIIGFDQRGCGASTAIDDCRQNTTAHLVQDIESLRRHLGISQWLVVGGSWGATLALHYACRHPDAITGLLLRGTFVPAPTEVNWFWGGAAPLFPQAWQQLARHRSASKPADIVAWLHEVFHGHDVGLMLDVARAWHGWEQALSGTQADARSSEPDWTRAMRRCRVQAHYLIHGFWTDPEEWLRTWRSSDRLRRLPVQFLHGQQDRICRLEAARSLQQNLAGSRIESLEGCGHNPFHPAMSERMREKLRTFAQRGTFANEESDVR